MEEIIEGKSEVKTKGLSREQKDLLIQDLLHSEDVQLAFKVRKGEEELRIIEELKK